MATENETSTDETSDQETEVQQDVTTSETEGNGNTSQDTPVTLPDDHPLVKTLAANKTKIAAQNTELAELRAKSAAATKLEEELNARPTQEALDTLQTRYDRLEGFLQAVGGPLSKALDSRSFTKALFESSEDIEDIVKNWQKANPTATSQALGSAGISTEGKIDPNKLLRIAAGKE